MRVRICRNDDVSNFEFASFETDAPPRIGEQIRFNDDGEAFFKVVQVIHDLERFGRDVLPSVIVVVSPELHEPRYDLHVVWQDETERPEWMPENLQIFSDIVPRRGEIITIAVFDPKERAALKMGNYDVHPHAIDVEVAAVAHGSVIEQTDEDAAQRLGLGDLGTELQVRIATQFRGDIQRFLARN